MSTSPDHYIALLDGFNISITPLGATVTRIFRKEPSLDLSESHTDEDDPDFDSPFSTDEYPVSGDNVVAPNYLPQIGSKLPNSFENFFSTLYPSPGYLEPDDGYDSSSGVRHPFMKRCKVTDIGVSYPEDDNPHLRYRYSTPEATSASRRVIDPDNTPGVYRTQFKMNREGLNISDKTGSAPENWKWYSDDEQIADAREIFIIQASGTFVAEHHVKTLTEAQDLGTNMADVDNRDGTWLFTSQDYDEAITPAGEKAYVVRNTYVLKYILDFFQFLSGADGDSSSGSGIINPEHAIWNNFLRKDPFGPDSSSAGTPRWDAAIDTTTGDYLFEVSQLPDEDVIPSIRHGGTLTDPAN